jgi:hypothetical protein
MRRRRKKTEQYIIVSDQAPVEEIWVNVEQGAEKTGFHPDHVRRLARENNRLPEDQRFIRVRKDPREYAIWLPDLINYVKRGNPFAHSDSTPQAVEKIWVSTGEGAELTGYNMDYLRQLAYRMWQQPEDERPIRIRNRARRYEFWLPDLIAYFQNFGHGPHTKRSEKE